MYPLPSTINIPISPILTSARVFTNTLSPFFIGLQFEFEFDSSVVYHIDKPYIVNLNNGNSLIQSIDIVIQINKLLLEAGCAHVSQLVGKPVEIIMDDKGNIENFSILTEVL